MQKLTFNQNLKEYGGYYYDKIALIIGNNAIIKAIYV